MKNTKIIFTILLAAALLALAVMTGCGSQSAGTTAPSAQSEKPAAADTSAEAVEPEDDSPYAFVFTGSGTTGGAIDTSEFPYKPLEGQNFTVSITGYKEDQSVELTVAEAPQIVMGGTYEFVEGKGYKIYLEDVYNTFVYTNYDPATKAFSFDTTIVFNTAIGFLDATYTYADEAFASKYDGVGFDDIHTPVFESAVSVMPGGKCLLKTDDKGNFVWYGLSGMGGDYCKRTGTWSFDSAANEYVFNFNDGVFRNLSTLWMTINWSDENIETYRNGDRSGLTAYPEEASADIDAFNAYLAENDYFDGEVRAPFNAEKGYYYLNFAMMNCLGTDYTSGAPAWGWATYTPDK